MTRSTYFVAVLLGSLAVGACSDLDSDPLAPEAFEPSQARSSKAAPAKGEVPIAQIAIDAATSETPQFTQLVAALQYVDLPEEQNAGLVDLFLNGTDQFTVFAPTDEAFENLYGLLEAFIGPVSGISDVPSSVVLDVLLYHVAEGRRGANSVVPKKNDRVITPLLGETFSVRADGTIQDGLTGLREDATIVLPNISASNGIIHVIDQVIVPPSVVEFLLSLL
jgi:uncharacterized surface protein with fasciclin (FAS1) repeats